MTQRPQKKAPRPERPPGARILAFKQPFRRRYTPPWRLSLQDLPPTSKPDQRRTLIEKLRHLEDLKGPRGLRVVEVVVDRLLYNFVNRHEPRP